MTIVLTIIIIIVIIMIKGYPAPRLTTQRKAMPGLIAGTAVTTAITTRAITMDRRSNVEDIYDIIITTEGLGSQGL